MIALKHKVLVPSGGAAYGTSGPTENWGTPMLLWPAKMVDWTKVNVPSP